MDDVLSALPAELRAADEPPTDQLCRRCQKMDLHTLLASPLRTTGQSCFYLSDLRKETSCPFCRLVLSALQGDPGVKALADGLCVMQAIEFGTIKAVGSSGEDWRPRLVNRLWFTLSVDGRTWTTDRNGTMFGHGVQQLAQPSAPAEEGLSTLLLGRRVDPQRADIALLRRWLEICDEDHAQTCKPIPMPISKKRSFLMRVIDIKHRRVIEAPLNCRYLALSYVWGAVKQLELNARTWTRLTSIGGLSGQDPEYSQSVTDAIILCELLGQAYLWVDALCIKQDDADDRALQCSRMDAIYQGAIFTIVSAAGIDANGGLPGVRPVSRLLEQQAETVKGVDIITTLRPFLPAMRNAKWDTRGWTFQEKMLSSRLLVFTEHQIFWHCNAATWFEDTVLENRDHGLVVKLTEDKGISHFSKPARDLPPFARYASLLRGYANRDLSRSEDALVAFMGITETLRPDLGHIFIWGLPQSMFNAAFLWRTMNHFPQRRRAQFPSWSWTVWEGGEGGGVELEAFTATDTRSEVVWFRLRNDGAQTMIQVQDSHELHHPDSVKEDSYADLRAQWRPREDYPIPPYQRLSTHPEPSHLLRFWTSIALLTVDYQGPDLEQRFNCDRLAIRTADGTVISHIYLNIEWRRTRPASLQFIVVSRDISTWDKDWQAGLNTLLIETADDGVAYRVQRPITPFDEAKWVGSGPEWKVITLG